MGVFQCQAHSAVMVKRPTAPDQDQRKLESPLASFPFSPWQPPGVGTGGAEGGVKKNLEEDCGESSRNQIRSPPFLWDAILSLEYAKSQGAPCFLDSLVGRAALSPL